MELVERIFKKIVQARIYDAVVRTPLEKAEHTSLETGNNVLMKREDLQSVFSFKIRGAYNAIRCLPEDRRRGVVCASAGNHAQGVSASAGKLGIPSYVFMPDTTPDIKIDAVRRLGGNVRFAPSLTECQKQSREMADAEGLALIHPYDDEDVIAGQGTIGLELFHDCSHLDYVFVPVGGGGLISGIAACLKTLSPETKIIGVEPENSNSLEQALKHGEPVTLDQVGIFADGVAVSRIGDLPFKICKDLVDEVLLVSVDKICSAMKRIFYENRVLVEPSGALSLAGAVEYIRSHGLKGRNIATITCGANTNFDLLRFAAQNAKVGEGKEVLLAVEIPERPSTLKKLCSEVIKDYSITEFNYRFSGPGNAQVFIGLETKSPDDRAEINRRLKSLGYQCVDLTENSLSKNHIRSMIGGHCPKLIDNERVFSVVFPERRNALSDMLGAMEISWSITLFHYVYNGSRYNHVFIGFNVPPEDNKKLEEFLRNLNYKFEEQTDNPAYQIFLRKF